MIFAACNTENGIDVATYEALGSTMTMDDLLDILEMKAVRDSWTHAALFDHDEKAAHEAAVREAASKMGGGGRGRRRGR